MENTSPEYVNLPNSKPENWQIVVSYILASLAIINISLALFFPAFTRLEKNPNGFDGKPLFLVETFWEFSIFASVLFILIAVSAAILLLIKRPRKMIYVALAVTLVYFGVSYLHEQAKQAKIYALYPKPSSESNSNLPRELRKAADDFIDAYIKLERTYIESETYGRAWTAIFVAAFTFWIAWFIQFSKSEYKAVWNWTLSKVPMFEQKFKSCSSCGGSNYFEASRCKHCNTPFVSN